MKIYVLKLIDKFFRLFFRLVLSDRQNTIHLEVGKILVIRPGGIGDAVLLIPMLKKLQTTLPEVKIDVLAEKRNAGVFQWTELSGTVFSYDVVSDYQKFWRHQSYDIVIDSEQWHFLTGIFARYLGRYTVGFSTNDRNINYDLKVPFSLHAYEAKSFFRLYEALCNQLKKPAEEDFVIPFLSFCDDDSVNTIYDICIFTGASRTEKKWAMDRYKELIDKFLSMKLNVVFIGGKEDVAFNDQLLKGVTEVTNLTGNTSLIESAHVITKSKVLVSGDSGILHMGVASGCRTVALFGPSNAEKWGYISEHNILIQSDIDCAPCSHFGNMPKCMNGYQCMNDIQVADVKAAVMQMIDL